MICKIQAVWRTLLLSAVLPAALAACTTDSTPAPMAMMRMADADAVQRYAVPPGEKLEVDAVDLSEMDPKNLRQLVDYRTTQPPGTVVVDPHKRFLYLVMENGMALASARPDWSSGVPRQFKTKKSGRTGHLHRT
jgi:lipoprotein-anchoring transpeptidase ErfK/SrfK